MAGFLYCIFYTLLFSFIILRSAFFKLPQFKNIHTLLLFYLKLTFGIVLWYIYAYHYKNRLTADIFKYFDDGKIIYNAFHENLGDFVKLCLGVDSKSPQIRSYYMQMNSWNNSYESSLYNNSHLIIRFNALLMLISGGHYTVHVIVMCFISLTGLTYLYKTFYPYIENQAGFLLAAVFLFPSVLLWSSGVLKESFILFGLGLSFYYFEKLTKETKSKMKNILLFLLGLAILFENKAYVFICIMPCFIAEFICIKTIWSKRHPFITYFATVAIYIGIGLNLGLINPWFNPLKMLSLKQQEFNNVAKGGIYMVKEGDTSTVAYHCIYLPISDSLNIYPANSYTDSLLHKTSRQYLASNSFYNKERAAKRMAYFNVKKGVPLLQLYYGDTLHLAGDDTTRYWLDVFQAPAKSRVNISAIKPSIAGLIAAAPGAIILALFRPFPGEIHSGTLLLYSLQNLLVFLLILFAIIFIKKKYLVKSKIAFCLVYCLLMLILIGLVTPLYGGIERYKALVMPFLLILLVLICDTEKLTRLIKKSS
jgi:hypothetical protein